MSTILYFALTNIASFIAGTFLHKWLAKEVIHIISPDSTPK